jgi:hypothetical protein
MTEADQVAAVLADGVWHSERSLFNDVGCPEWFYATMRKMGDKKLVEKQYDPWGVTWWRLW